MCVLCERYSELQIRQYLKYTFQSLFTICFLQQINDKRYIQILHEMLSQFSIKFKNKINSVYYGNF